MENNFEQCAAIKFCSKVGFTAAKMWEMIVKVFGDFSVSRATVFRWHTLFATGTQHHRITISSLCSKHGGGQ